MRYLLSLLLAFLAFFSHAQPSGISNTKFFDIKIAGVKIGELVATRTWRDTVTLYQLESKVKVWLIVPIAMEHKIETVYHGKNLFSSLSVSTTNSGTYRSTIIWKGRHYQTHVDSYHYKNSTPIYEQIECNIARFYFEEPVNIPKTLADSFGTMASITEVSPGHYEVDSQGNVNRYHYKDGLFVSASLFSKVRYEVLARNDKALAFSDYRE